MCPNYQYDVEDEVKCVQYEYDKVLRFHHDSSVQRHRGDRLLRFEHLPHQNLHSYEEACHHLEMIRNRLIRSYLDHTTIYTQPYVY